MCDRCPDDEVESLITTGPSGEAVIVFIFYRYHLHPPDEQHYGVSATNRFLGVNSI